jgi:hypothetical protein
MKRLSLALSLLVLLAGLVYGGSMASFKGYLVDNACAGKMKDDLSKAKGHPKGCALMRNCAASGYALITDDGKVYKLDEEGNKKAAEAYKNTKSDKGLAVNVEGTLDGDTLKVSKLEESM